MLELNRSFLQESAPLSRLSSNLVKIVIVLNVGRALAGGVVQDRDVDARKRHIHLEARLLGGRRRRLYELLLLVLSIDEELCCLRCGFPDLDLSRLDCAWLSVRLLTLLHPVAISVELGGLLLELRCLSGDLMGLTAYVLVIVHLVHDGLLPGGQRWGLGCTNFLRRELQDS